jgi:hypothetical protein
MAWHVPCIGGVRRVLVTSALSLTFFLQVTVPGTTAEPGSLAPLEQQIATSPGLLADQLEIQAAADDVRETRDKSGLAYTYSNDIGPEAIIVPYNVDDHVLRFEQAVGIKLPLLGTETAEMLLIVDAEKREQIAKIAMNAAYRNQLAQLREAYVHYWADRRDIEIADVYLSGVSDERPQALSLLHQGFWTQTQYLDYVTTINDIDAQENESRNLSASHLALIASSLGHAIDPFDPDTPEFYENCVPNRTTAMTSAFDVDTALAQLQAESAEVVVELGRVKGSSIDASATLTGGSQTDINHQVSGYDVLAGIDVSLPQRARDEERAARDKYQTELQQIALEAQQRKAEIVAQIDAAITELSSDEIILAQAKDVQQVRWHDLSNAIAKLNTLKQAPQDAFTDVHAKRGEVYESTRAVSAAEADLFLKANELLKLAPGACGGSYDSVEPFAPAIRAPSQKNTDRSPSAQNR